MSKPRTEIERQERRLAELDAIADVRRLTVEEEAEQEELCELADGRRRALRSRLPRQIAAMRTKLARMEATAHAIGVSHA